MEFLTNAHCAVSFDYVRASFNAQKAYTLK